MICSSYPAVKRDIVLSGNKTINFSLELIYKWKNEVTFTLELVGEDN